eukprot:847756-Rhodomonas_salina.1
MARSWFTTESLTPDESPFKVPRSRASESISSRITTCSEDPSPHSLHSRSASQNSDLTFRSASPTHLSSNSGPETTCRSALSCPRHSTPRVCRPCVMLQLNQPPQRKQRTTQILSAFWIDVLTVTLVLEAPREEAMSRAVSVFPHPATRASIRQSPPKTTGTSRIAERSAWRRPRTLGIKALRRQDRLGQACARVSSFWQRVDTRCERRDFLARASTQARGERRNTREMRVGPAGVVEPGGPKSRRPFTCRRPSSSIVPVGARRADSAGGKTVSDKTRETRQAAELV